MDFRKLVTRYKQFGGHCLVWQYAKLGVLPVVVKGVLKCVKKRQSFKSIYPEVLKRVEPKLIAKYGSRVQKLKGSGLEHGHPTVIWWCWLQGKEQAPPVVQACYTSLKKNLPEYEVRAIDSDNWKEYIELPDYIVKKWLKKQIPPALFSDLLRLQLLIKYGGTWIDSTVLCTGVKGAKVQEFNNYLNTDLFLFQYSPEGTIKDISISNWFISACSNNEVLMSLRDLLFAYWNDYNCTLDYYIFHLFFSMVAKEYPEQIATMPYGYSINSLVLLHHWHETYDSQKWEKLTNNVGFHKLAFRIDREIIDNKDNYYNKIIEEYGHI